jgi:hypothetical protein
VESGTGRCEGYKLQRWVVQLESGLREGGGRRSVVGDWRVRDDFVQEGLLSQGGTVVLGGSSAVARC